MAISTSWSMANTGSCLDPERRPQLLPAPRQLASVLPDAHRLGRHHLFDVAHDVTLERRTMARTDWMGWASAFMGMVSRVADQAHHNSDDILAPTHVSPAQADAGRPGL
jgi:hypothetical protein